MTWQMYASEAENGRLTTIGHKTYVEMHGFNDPVVPVTVEEVESDDETATHFGWMGSAYLHYEADTEPNMIWDKFFLFEMCFPYGVEPEVRAGKGRVARLRITKNA